MKRRAAFHGHHGRGGRREGIEEFPRLVTEKLGAPDRILDRVPGTSKQRKRSGLRSPNPSSSRADQVIE